ncbi:MAG: PQQ-dependent sugar dehydrogenase [Anaerolineales bacterium]|nr:PQQ-dependent sugar dehydrogenase [Anaerolineales bacterium]
MAETVFPTITPLTHPTPASAPQSDSQPQPATPATPQTQSFLPNVSEFPNANNYEWRLIASGLNRPVDVQSALDGSGRLFIIEKYGVIRAYENGQLLAQPFLDIKDRVNDDGNEMGLLGLAFHPDYEQNGFFYVNYTGTGGNTFISRFQASGNLADAGSESILLKVNQPYPNHNGGAVVFGPDGYLYLGLGDGGAGGDPHKNGQDTASLLGKILRIDVNSSDPYSIPSDNPFGNEAWAYGLRNPWRISFDRATGDLWIGDVGQGDWEEIDYLPAGSPGGANFGWSLMEGNHGYDGQARPGLLLPAAEYSHSYGGCSVTGGYVYRGAMPEWNGIYLYGDYCSGYVWGLILSDGQWQSQLLFEADVKITSFGQDESGEIYLASDAGGVYFLIKK